MVRDRPFARSFAFAAIVHVFALGLVSAYVRTAPMPRVETPPLEIAIEETVEAPPPAIPELERSAAPLPEQVASRSSMRASQRATAAAETAALVPPLVAAAEPSTTASAEPWSPQVLRATGGDLAQLGLTPEGRAHALATQGGPGEEGASPGDQDVGGLQSALAARDFSLGLGAGGPLVAAVEDVTSSSRAPVDGAATFVIDADEKGGVTSVRAADVSSDEDTWREVAAL